MSFITRFLVATKLFGLASNASVAAKLDISANLDCAYVNSPGDAPSTIPLSQGAYSGNAIPRYSATGLLYANDSTAATGVVNNNILNSRLTASQRAAIDALDSGTATTADIVNALKAV